MSQRKSGFPLGIWVLGIIISALCLGSLFLPKWWYATSAAGAGLVLTIIFGLRARACAKSRHQAMAEAEQQLQGLGQNLNHMEAAVLAAPLPTLLCDPDQTIIAASASVGPLAGRQGAVAKGESLASVLGAEAATAAADGTPDEGVETQLSSGQPVRLFASKTTDQTLVVQALSREGELEIVQSCELQQEEFRGASNSINDLAQQLASSAELLSAYADDQAKGSTRQKEQTTAVAGSIERMMSAVMEVASNASATSEAAQEARNEASDGVDLVHKAVDGINILSASAQELAEVLAGLDNQAAEIGRIIGVITDIADQTNLLALNAAIEAARAGDAGRGFAVVADEVRKLAEKTMTATQEVKDSIGTIQASSKDAMESMDRTGTQVEQSTDLSNQAGQALEKVMEQIEGMVSRVKQIAQAAEEQSSAAEEISTSVEEIAEIARDTDEGTTQQAFATRDISRLCNDLLALSRAIAGGEKAPTLGDAQGQMKGVLPKLMQDFVKNNFETDVYEAMQEELGEPVFLPSESYPDTVLHQMADLVSATSGMDVAKILYNLGLHTVDGFHRLYPSYFRTKDLKAFYLSMNDIHAEVTRDMPGVVPPRFTFEDKGDVLFMNYQSKRALFDYFEGVLNGAAKFFGQATDVKIKPLSEDTARAEIHFLECEEKTQCGIDD